MPRELLIDLADCSEFRQTLAARPPRIVHGTALLLMSLLAAALAWSALVKADLVVRTTGRVRSVEMPTRIFTSASADLAGRVAEAPFDEGDVVRQGDLLVRLDTALVDNQVAKLQRTIAAADEELATLTGLETLLSSQFDSALAKAQAELEQAEAALARAVDQRESEIRRTQADLKAAEEYLLRCQKLRESRVVTEQELTKAETDLHQAQEKLVQAKLPVDKPHVAIARRAVELVERDFGVRRAELKARQVVKQGEAEAARRELANLELQRAEAVLRSPLDGVVVTGHVQPGDVLEPGKPLMEIAPQQGYRFEAVVPSQDVGDLRVGMPVQIKFDAYDYQKYGVLAGKICYLSPDSRLTDEEDQESYAAARRTTPAGFLVRIELAADEVGRGELRGRVKLGLGGTAEIVTGRESVLTILLKRMRQSISLG